MKRKRSHNVSVRLSDEEYERLQYKLSHSDMTLTEFLIKAINGQQIRIIKAYIPLLAELKRQGTNLNQLTHRINEYSSVKRGSLRQSRKILPPREYLPKGSVFRYLILSV